MNNIPFHIKIRASETNELCKSRDTKCCWRNHRNSFLRAPAATFVCPRFCAPEGMKKIINELSALPVATFLRV